MKVRVTVLLLLIIVLLPSSFADVTRSNRAQTISTLVNDFYNVKYIDFPEGSCAEIAKGLYESIAYTPTDEVAGFATEGPNKVASISYVLDRVRKLGTIDLIESNVVGLPIDSFISMNTKAIVRVPKDERTTFFALDLYGINTNVYHVVQGKFAIPSLECNFVNNNGQAICDCQTHTMRDLGIAGIPPAVTIVERSGIRWHELAE